MKTIFKSVLIAALLTPLAVWSAPANNITVNEVGTNSFQYWLGTTTALPWELAPDPTGGLPDNYNVLIYTLPFAGVAGDVLLNDTTEPTNAGWNMMFPDYNILDVVRFDGNYHLIFYSDGSVDGISSPADTLVPPNPLFANQVIIDEIGTEENNWANYYPQAGQPGFDPSYVRYLFISDVPEPGTLAMVGSGLAVLLFIARRRQGK